MRMFKRPTTLLLLLGCVFLSFGYTTDGGSAISKIYLHGNTLIRTSPGHDIRFYDIANPAQVREIGDLSIEGNSDVAVMGSIMYADQERDLVVYDISDPANARPLDTIANVFRRAGSQVLEDGGWTGGEGNAVGGASGCGADGCETGGSSTSSSDEWATNDQGFQPFSYSATGGGMSTPVRSAASTGSTGGSNASGGSTREGTGGSLARFIIVANRLYCIDDQNLIAFDITQPAAPVEKSRGEVAQMIETIFYANYHLFIGGQQGVYIYDIEDNATPTFRSEFSHADRCDPVVVDGNRAYVTLRGGSPCGGFSNQMDILDVSDIDNPRLLSSYPTLDSPFGLAVKNDVAVVCDGRSGLRILDVGNSQRVTECSRLDDIAAYDVIWHNNTLIVSTDKGFYLYDATNPCKLKEYGLLF